LFRLRIWELRGLRRGVGYGRCPFDGRGRNGTHILLKCQEIYAKMGTKTFEH